MSVDNKKESEIKQKADELFKKCEELSNTQRIGKTQKSAYLYDELDTILSTVKEGIPITGQLNALKRTIDNFKVGKFDPSAVLRDRAIDKLLPTINEQIKDLNNLLGYGGEKEKQRPTKG